MSNGEFGQGNEELAKNVEVNVINGVVNKDDEEYTSSDDSSVRDIDFEYSALRRVMMIALKIMLM